MALENKLIIWCLLFQQLKDPVEPGKKTMSDDYLYVQVSGYSGNEIVIFQIINKGLPITAKVFPDLIWKVTIPTTMIIAVDYQPGVFLVQVMAESIDLLKI